MRTYFWVMDNFAVDREFFWGGYVVLYRPVLTAAQVLRCTCGSLVLLLSYMV